MASSSLTVKCSGKKIRKYGGNRSDVRYMKNHYQSLTLEQFLSKHPFLNEEDYLTMELYARFNKN